MMVILLLGVSAGAETIVFGTSGSNNVLPFGAYYTGSTYRTSVGMEYTQIYGSNGFAQRPLLISDIGFVSIHLTSGRGAIATQYDVEIAMGYTEREPSGAGSGVDGPMTPLFSGVTSATLTEDGSDFDLIFHLSQPFLFDPSQGNLAFKVVLKGLVFDTTSSQNGFTFRAGASDLMARDVSGLQPFYGLVTAFSSDGQFPAYAVPEPTAASMLAAMAAGAALRYRPRRVGA